MDIISIAAEWTAKFGLIAHLGEEVGENGFQLPMLPHILALAGCAVIAYLLGSLNFAIIISKYKFHDDIRKHGSGNGGMTNMMRTYGKAAAGFTLFGDAMKAVVAVLIGMLVAGESGGYIAGLSCILGHAFPAYYKFKGGKGVVTSAVMVLCLDPVVFSILLIFFLIIAGMTKYISLGSVMCMIIYPMLLNRMYPTFHRGEQPGAVVTVVSILIALLVVFLHRTNIKRLLAGTESKFSFKGSKAAKAPPPKGRSLMADDLEPDTGEESGDAVPEKPELSASKPKKK